MKTKYERLKLLITIFQSRLSGVYIMSYVREMISTSDAALIIVVKEKK